MAETTATAPVPPEPIILPEDLDAYEEQRIALEAQGLQTPDLILPTVRDAQRAARRLAEIRRDAAALAAIYDEEIERLQQQIEALRERREQAMRPFERRARWYEGALEQWMREQNRVNPKQKTYRLPAGDIRLRAQQPEWVYGSDLVERLKEIGATDYIRVKEEPDRAAIKRSAQIVNGRAALVDQETGEVHELPIQVVPRPPKFEFVPAEVTDHGGSEEDA